jgi:hypothetical protein
MRIAHYVNIPGPWVSPGFSPTAFGRATLLRADGTLWAVTTNATDYSNWQMFHCFRASSNASSISLSFPDKRSSMVRFTGKSGIMPRNASCS